MNWKRTWRFSSASLRACRGEHEVPGGLGTVLFSSPGVNGLARKSYAPRLVAVTAVSSEA